MKRGLGKKSGTLFKKRYSLRKYYTMSKRWTLIEKRDSVRKLGLYLKKGDSNLEWGIGKKSKTLIGKVGLSKKTGTL